MITSMQTFKSLGLSAPVLEALAAEGYTTPTPIQAKAMPHVLAGRDLFGCAQTGTGKTAAFALPLIERLMADRREVQPHRCRVLVLAPTRELASQIHDSFRAYGKHAKLRSAVIYGGVNQKPQAAAMQRGVDVLVATPGRLLDLIQQRLVDIRSVEFLVLDEADRMLDMGFIHDVRKIVAQVPRKRQTLFFSATLPAEVRHLAETMLHDPLEVKTAPQATPAETVEQSVFLLPQRQKKHLLVHLLKHEGMARVIVFTRTKHGANKLQRDLEKAGIRAAAIHGNKSQNQRELALSSFKSQRPPVLIATDIAARGIDVDQVTHVVNFELPHEPETYVHRIGRTGRAGFTGAAVSFCDREERPRLAAIERLLRKQIPERTDLPADLPKADEAEERGPKRPPAHAGRRGDTGRAEHGRAEHGRAEHGRGDTGRARDTGRPGRSRHSDGGPRGGTKPAKGRRGKGKPRGEKRAAAATPAAAPAAGAKPRGTKKYRRAL